MKNFYVLSITLFLSMVAIAQSPQAFKYQTVVRNANNDILSNQPVGLKISILQGSASGTAVYVETHAVTTNVLGIVNLNIGQGIFVSGSFLGINWGTNSYYVKIELDPAGGNAYQYMGTSELLSVPYALYAESGNEGPIGPQGPQGDQGPQGPAGPTGATGATGASGPQGPAGVDGKTVLNGTTNPTAGIGVNGDFYINTTTNMLFGPKASGVWPAGVSMVGPQGPQGIQGIQGPTGPTGATGPAGPAGATGPVGPQGPMPPIGGANTQVQYNSNGSFSGSSNLVFDYTNNRLGVGTATPSHTLHVNGNTRLGGLLIDASNSSGSTGQILTRTLLGTGWQTITIPDPSQWSNSGSNIYFNTGNVGIGNSNPTQNLHVTGNMRLTGQFYDTYNSSGVIGQVLKRVSNGAAWLDESNPWDTYGSTGIFYGGNVGIGVSNPNRPLLVQNSTLGSGTGMVNSEYTGTGYVDPYGFNADVFPQDGYGIGVRINSGYSGIYSEQNHTTYTSYTYGIRSINNGSNTGSKYALNASVDGSAGTCYAVYASVGGAAPTKYAGWFSGNVLVSGTFSNPSDRTLKQDIEPLPPALEKLRHLEVYEYSFKPHKHMTLPEGRSFGFMAKEMELIFPELVTDEVLEVPDESDKLRSDVYHFNGINYIGMIPVLTKAIQEQQEMIEKQQHENSELRTELESLKTQFEELKMLIGK